jgi:hypothetical protein
MTKQGEKVIWTWAGKNVDDLTREEAGEVLKEIDASPSKYFVPGEVISFLRGRASEELENYVTEEEKDFMRFVGEYCMRHHLSLMINMKITGISCSKDEISYTKKRPAIVRSRFYPLERSWSEGCIFDTVDLK